MYEIAVTKRYAVLDEVALIEAATACGRFHGRDNDWVPEGVQEAIEELELFADDGDTTDAGYQQVSMDWVRPERGGDQPEDLRALRQRWLIRDWRISDGDIESVPRDLQGVYTVAASPGPYDNLVLQMRTPGGLQSTLRIEAENGQFKLIAYTPDIAAGSSRDDCDMIARLTTLGAVAYGNTDTSPTVVFDGKQCRCLGAHEGRRMLDALEGRSS